MSEERGLSVDEDGYKTSKAAAVLASQASNYYLLDTCSKFGFIFWSDGG